MRNPIDLFALGALRAYQLTLSSFMGRGCRYMPSCSHYGMNAIGAHGFWRGGWMLLARLCRCHPFGSSGWDPAPERAPLQAWWAPWRYGDWAWGERPAKIEPAKLEEAPS